MERLIWEGDAGAPCGVEPCGEILQVVSPASAPDQDTLESLIAE
jgi:hypothetical protein